MATDKYNKFAQLALRCKDFSYKQREARVIWIFINWADCGEI